MLPEQNTYRFGDERSIPKPYPKTRGELERAKALYLAGILEAGVGISLNVVYTSRVLKSGITSVTSSVTSALYFSDQNRRTTLGLQGMFGGHFEDFASKKDSSRWMISKKYEILDLLRTIYPFAPSRQAEIGIFEKFATAENSKEESDAVAQLKQVQAQQKPHLALGAYRRLVAQPAFIAGTFDSRGHLYPATERQRYDYVVIDTKNKSLAEAICVQYGGSSFDINPAPHVVKHRSGFVNAPAHNFLHVIGPYKGGNLYELQRRIENGRQSPSAHVPSQTQEQGRWQETPALR